MAKRQKLTVKELRERLDRCPESGIVAVILTMSGVTEVFMVVEVDGVDDLLHKFERFYNYDGTIQV